MSEPTPSALVEALEKRADEIAKEWVPTLGAGLFVRDLRAAAAFIRSTMEAVKWAQEVHPDTLPDGGANVHMTWDEFNAMRALVGKKPLKPARRLTGATDER